MRRPYKAASLLKLLDNIDQLVDVGDVENSAQINHAMIEYGTTGIPNYWLRGQRTTYTTVPPQPLPSDTSPPVSMTEYLDGRSAASFELLVDAAASPPDRRARAIQQARLPIRMGGAGILNEHNIPRCRRPHCLPSCVLGPHAYLVPDLCRRGRAA